MSQRLYRSVVSIVLTLLIPAQLLGQDSASAMVYANGSASVNGTEIPKSGAVFSGDKVETKLDSSANINTNGSSVMVLEDSLVTYEGSAIGVDRGSVRVSTESGFAAHACEVKATPANLIPTQYQFTHHDGRVTVVATKADVVVENHGEKKTVAEGQQIERDDGCPPAAERVEPHAPFGFGSPAVRYIGIGTAIGIITWLLWPDGHDMSPACPKKPCQ